MNVRKVDFFFVGYPKCGSTTFYNLIKSHPECFAPEIKEPKYFSSDFNQELKRNLRDNYYQMINSEDDYNSLFVGGMGKIKGDFNTFNILSTEAAQNIYQYNPDAKIIISLREPVSFLRSFHFQSLYRMIENEPDFIKALDLEKNRRSNQNIPVYCYNPFYLYYSSLVEYSKQIKRFTDLFGRKKVKILFFDHIVSDEYKVFQDILKFLGAKDLDFKPPKPGRNPSHALRFVWLRKIIFTPAIRKWIYTRTPRRIFTLGGRVGQWIFKKEQDKPFVSDEDILHLKKRFTPNVEELSAFLRENHLTDENVSVLWNY